MSPTSPEPRRFPFRLQGPLWIGLATVLLSLAAAGDDDPIEENSGKDIPLTRQQRQIGMLIDEAANYSSAASRQYDTVLRERFAILDRVCGLTDAQKEKLQLAARSDKKRIIERAEEIGTQLQLVENDLEKATALVQDARLIRRGIITPGSSFAGEYFVKSLERQLTAEQALKYAPLRPVFRARGLVQLRRRGSDDVVEINQTETAFADNDLAQLSAWPASPALCSLILTGTKVTDAGLKHLKGLTHLRDLDLSQTQISDAGLDELKGLTTLKHLTLRGLNERLSDAAANELKRALPMLEVHW